MSLSSMSLTLRLDKLDFERAIVLRDRIKELKGEPVKYISREDKSTQVTEADFKHLTETNHNSKKSDQVCEYQSCYCN
jgi:hypothetical protein